MSCWVVPSLAAEYLGISIDEIMTRVAAGVMTMRKEAGFDMIDVAPDSPRYAKGADKSNGRTAVPKAPAPPISKPRAQPEPFDADERDTFGDWRAARASTARTRKAPILN